MSGLSTTAIALIIAIIGPVLAYLATARKLSGKIATSEASDLWEEARYIRQDYQKRIEQLNGVVGECQTRITTLEKRNEALYLENGNLKHMIEEHELTIAELRDSMHRLAGENTDLKKENDELRVTNGKLRDTNIQLEARVTELEVNNGSH